MEEENDNTLTVSAGEIEWMKISWQRRWNRPPTAQELDSLIQQYVRETVLYREALAMGLDKDDIVIRRRMAQKMEFLAQDLAALIPSTEEDLQAWFDQHRASYEEPVRSTFTQVFIDPDKRGNATLDDTEAIKATLSAHADSTANAAAVGDRSLLQSYYTERSQAELQKLFGGGFAESLAELEPGQWHGPVLSGYGVHLVYLHARTEPPPPVFANVRDRVKKDWKDAKRQELNEQFYASLRDRCQIVIEKDVASSNEFAALPEPAR